MVEVDRPHALGQAVRLREPRLDLEPQEREAEERQRGDTERRDPEREPGDPAGERPDEKAQYEDEGPVGGAQRAMTDAV